jgi:hypothetical protein
MGKGEAQSGKCGARLNGRAEWLPGNEPPLNEERLKRPFSNSMPFTPMSLAEAL